MAKRKFSLELKGVDKFKKKMSKIENRLVSKAIESHLFKEGEGIMAQSKSLVPVDTGTLRSSGHVQLPKRIGNRIVVTLGYGGPSAPYAIPVHENLQVFHKVGVAKYLSLPFRQAARGFPKRLAARLRKEIR